MPTYSYKCNDCDLSKDLNRQVDDRDLPVKCEQCDSDMKRGFVAAPIQFKGSGFYSTGG
jgi:putative FmdB family regulatory protein